ncbi:hypothetical protein [Rhodanobacter sp. B05]|uniref:hypothetical protein n=1 Tax=Rhodanobacter sp. B05 TaxID=1945859 RepID=UPI0011156B1D|nr:hypothetical protein [Rhodanobacter sp. B05]
MTSRKVIDSDPYAHVYGEKCFHELSKFNRLLPKYTLAPLRDQLNIFADRADKEYFDYIFELKSKGLVIRRMHSGEEDLVATQIKYPRLRKLLKTRRVANALLAIFRNNSRGDHGTD